MNLLLLTILSPLLGVAIIWSLSDDNRSAVRSVALGSVLLTLVLAGYVVLSYPQEDFAVSYSWLAGGNTGLDVRLAIGLDGLNVWLFGLSALLMWTCVLVSWEAIEERPSTFYMLLLLLETGILGVFVAQDLILFYVFFEFTLIPLFFLIGIWGHEERRYAAIKFFLFTLAGSLLTLIGLLAIVMWDFYHGEPHAMQFSISALKAGLQAHPIGFQLQMWLFLALFAGFAIKVPLFPLHTWLPLAHVQAPTAGSVVLAGVLLKLGTYGFVRFSMGFLPDAAAACAPWILWLSVAGIIYGALVALAQADMKRLIAYSSVSHLGFCMLGLFALNPLGIEGGVLQMINHGLSTGGLFALVGMLYERYHTREIAVFGGLAKRLPRLATMMLIFTFSSIGLPGLNGFVSEFLLLNGMFQRGWSDSPAVLGNQLLVIAVLAVSGVVLGAWYMLSLIERIFFGPLREPDVHAAHGHVQDLSGREVLALAPLIVFMLWIGLVPSHFLSRIGPTVDPIAAEVSSAFTNHYEPATETAALGPGGAEVTRSNHEVPALAEKPRVARTGD